VRVVIYSKDNCPWCDRAKDLMNTKNEEYTEIKIGRDITREEFMEQFPYVRTVPYIIHDGVEISSYEALKEHYNRAS